MSFNFMRLWAVIVKEFIQIKRDKATFAMIMGIPMIQLLLFGFAINTNPRNLPTAIVNADNTFITRRIISALSNSTYFQITKSVTEKEGKRLIREGETQFVISIPPNFTHDLIRGEQPALLLEADATDPAATSGAVAVFNQLVQTALKEELKGTLKDISSIVVPYQPYVHAVYNPLAITSYNIVPGLLGVVLTMTMVVITALAITREHERGTMENLLATPLRPLELMLGKIIPYIIVGYIQVLLILTAAHFIFHVPMEGSVFLLLILCLPFIAANLSMGITFSTIASNQLQATQSAMFFFLPSLLLSGFMFPFRGMPVWAQWIGSLLPLSHFLIIVRGILLKGNGFFQIWHQIVPIILFMVTVLTISFKRYRRTLD